MGPTGSDRPAVDVTLVLLAIVAFSAAVGLAVVDTPPSTATGVDDPERSAAVTPAPPGYGSTPTPVAYPDTNTQREEFDRFGVRVDYIDTSTERQREEFDRFGVRF